MSYANVVATLALVLALGGGTAWATNYIIVSTHQIKPSVLKSLRGNRGYRGYTGANGTNGTNGATGPAGAAGAPGAAGTDLTSQTPLPSGESESGFYAAADNSSTGDIGTGITYEQPLASPIADANIIWNKAGDTSVHCPGYGHADPGYLCLYDYEENGIFSTNDFYSSDGFSTPSTGAILFWAVNAQGNYVAGEYTVTAP